MTSIEQTASAQDVQANQESYTVPLIIITVLFFMWGLLTSMNGVLMPYLKNIYNLSYIQTGLVESAFFGAYFIASLPAGSLVKKVGYQNGMITGLAVAGLGCFLFYPASTQGYGMFLFALFVLGVGITILQVSANPYVTVLGPAKTASSRLTLTQAFNSVGTTIGPRALGLLILPAVVYTAAEYEALSAAELAIYRATEAAKVQMPYLVLGCVFIALVIFFSIAKLPKIQEEAPDGSLLDDLGKKNSIWKQKHLVLGAVGIFLYVGAEVAVASYLINFLGQPHIAGLSARDASAYLTYYWGGAMIGRFIGFVVMRHIAPGKVLAFNACGSVLLILLAVFSSGSVALWAIVAVGLCNSIMFPTIFSIALHKLGAFTSKGSGVLCLAIVGGAIVTPIQGGVADLTGLQYSFLVPAACYLFIMYYGIRYAGIFKTLPDQKIAAGH